MIKQKPLNMNAKRSISLIVHSLLELLKTDSFKEITITQITQNAGVVRNTFYAHFKTKEDILSYYIFDVILKKIDSLSTEDNSKELDMVETYFEVWAEQSELLTIMKINNLLEMLNHFETHLEIICFKTYVSENACRISEKSMQYATAFYTSALAGILNKWITTGMKESPKELTHIFHELESQFIKN